MELRERQTRIQEPKESFHIRKQIEDLEKRLLDLMTLKGKLTARDDHDSCSDKSLSELALSLEHIKKEISTLNSKVLSLSKLSPKEGVKREDAQINLDATLSGDKLSRHFGPTEESSESNCSTLSNGDKIIIGSNQSIVIVSFLGSFQIPNCFLFLFSYYISSRRRTFIRTAFHKLCIKMAWKWFGFQSTYPLEFLYDFLGTL